MKKKLSDDTHCNRIKVLKGYSNLGRISKGIKCSISGCDKEAKRSISAAKVKSSGLKIGEAERRAYLCKEHYKEYKKKIKNEKKVEQWRHKLV